LIQAFPKKWWVESDFTAPNLPLSLQFKGFGCEIYSVSAETMVNDGCSYSENV
jgi:hypothetical protein